MADETDNILIATQGADALMATDIMTNDGATAHAQVFKTSWGDDNFTYKANTNTPLPVRIYGSSGDTNRVVVTGGVFGLGSFTVTNQFANALYIRGGTGGPLGISGSIQGISNGYPINITGAVSIIGFVGITGNVSVTGGRGLSHATDSITIHGIIGTTRSWNLSSSDDTVKVSPAQGGFTHSTYIAGNGGVAIGSVSDALKVHVANTGFTIDATISPVVYVQNSTGDILRIRGSTWISETNPTPVVVRGTKAYSRASSGIDSGDMIITFQGSQPVQIANTPNFDVQSGSNVYKYLHGGTLGSANSVGVNVSAIQTNIGEISRRLNNPIPARVRNDTAQPSAMRNWFVSLNANSAQPDSIADTLNPNTAPIQGTHIKNLTYLRSVNDPPPVTIGIGTRNVGATGGFNLSMYLDPGESIFLPMSVSNLFAKIVDKSIDPNNQSAVYVNALGIMSI